MRVHSLVPDFGVAAPAVLDRFEWTEFLRQSRRALGRCGIERYLLSADVSLNHWERRRDEALFQFQLWGLLEEPRCAWRESLKEDINGAEAIMRPVFELNRGASRRR